MNAPRPLRALPYILGDRSAGFRLYDLCPLSCPVTASWVPQGPLPKYVDSAFTVFVHEAPKARPVTLPSLRAVFIFLKGRQLAETAGFGGPNQIIGTKSQ